MSTPFDGTVDYMDLFEELVQDEQEAVEDIEQLIAEWEAQEARAQEKISRLEERRAVLVEQLEEQVVDQGGDA